MHHIAKLASFLYHSYLVLIVFRGYIERGGNKEILIDCIDENDL